MTEPLFRDDAYLKTAEATVIGISERGGIVLDRSIFYPTSGGQPGDAGVLKTATGACPIATSVYDEDRRTIIHVPPENAALPEPGSIATIELDWPRRHAHMRIHTALHLLCSLIPFPVTGGQIGAGDGRLDFDIADAGALDKEDLTVKLNALVAADHSVSTRWITDAELEANPDLVRTMAVKPPMGSGSVRLVAIGDGGSVDLQPCGGTHVRSTAEIGPLAVTKIEKKGKQNRRVRLAFT
ncbi:MAG: alanyl-tRNA editing protein [Alphaproteobacteria bacterium]|nr:alanyl-tRNA editing protein [Alphaproteobacteria bacterium]